MRRNRSSPIKALYEAGKEVTLTRTPSGKRSVFSTEAICRMFSERAINISFVEMEKIFFPEKSQSIEVIAPISKTGSGTKITSILSGLRKKIGVAKSTKRPTHTIPPKKTHPTVLR